MPLMPCEIFDKYSVYLPACKLNEFMEDLNRMATMYRLAGQPAPQPAPLSADERAETLRVLKPFAEIGTRYLTDEVAKRTTHPSRILDHERPTVGECRLAAYLCQRLGEAKICPYCRELQGHPADCGCWCHAERLGEAGEPNP